MSRREDAPITFVVPGDLHLTEPGLANHEAALRVVEEVNGLIRPDFVQFIGDNVQDSTEAQFLLFDDLRSRLAVPHFALVGDHDVKDDPGAEGFRRHVGETTGATSIRGFRFLRLDTQQAKPVGMLPAQVEWLRDQVDGAIAAGERVFLFQHNYPYQVWETFDGPGIDDWRAIVQTRRVEAIVCGHTHYWQAANDGRNAVVAVRSIGDPEGGPPGYAIGHVRGDEFAITYRSAGDEAPAVQIVNPREALLATGPRHVVAGPDEVRARVWSADGAGMMVRARIDGGDWQGLESRGDGTWAGPLPGDRLAKGRHALEAEATDASGRVGRDRNDFLVDPTGHFTAVPMARPIVEATAFC